jgi:hypothetical protein
MDCNETVTKTAADDNSLLFYFPEIDSGLEESSISII